MRLPQFLHILDIELSGGVDSDKGFEFVIRQEFSFRRKDHIEHCSNSSMGFFVFAVASVISKPFTEQTCFTKIKVILSRLRFNLHKASVVSHHHDRLPLPLGRIIYTNMTRELQGFKLFFESDLSPVSPESGRAELIRLSRGHYFFALQTDHKLAQSLMKENLRPEFSKSSIIDATDVEKRIAHLTPDQDSLLVVCFPKRWEKSLGRVNPKEQFAKMIGEFTGSQQYVWGIYSLWNPQLEKHDAGHFFRNPLYHANDDLLNIWLKHHPSPVKEKPAVPLNRQPRIMGQHLLDQGRHSFHGYRELPQSDKSSGVD